MHFRFDGADKTWQANPPHLEPNSDPNPEGLDPQLRIEFLRLLNDGVGRVMACAQLGIGVRALWTALAECPSFRRTVEQIEQVRAERLYSVLYTAALNGDTRAALFLLARHDRAVDHRGVRTEA